MFWSCHLSLCLSVFMSVYRLLPSFCYSHSCLSCLLLFLLPVCLPPSLPFVFLSGACLPFCHLVHPSFVLSASCSLSSALSFIYILSYLSCLSLSCLYLYFCVLSRSISLICPIFLLQSLLPVLSVAVLLICTSACRLDHLCFSYAACLFVCHPSHPLKLLVTFFQNELRLTEKISYGH
jgi:hypothetical protein